MSPGPPRRQKASAASVGRKSTARPLSSRSGAWWKSGQTWRSCLSVSGSGPVQRRPGRIEEHRRVFVVAGGHRLAHQQRARPIVHQHGVEDRRHADRGRIAAGLGGAGANGVDRGLEVAGVSPHPDEDAVGDAAGHAQRARPARRDPDRHRTVVRQPGRARGADLDRLAVEQRAHEPRAALQLLDPGRTQPRQPHGRVADSPAEQDAAGRQLVDRRDGRRGDGRMAVDGIGQQRAQHDALGGLSGGRQHHVGVAASQLRIGEERGVPAERLGAPDVGGERRHRAAVESVQAEAWCHARAARTVRPSGVSRRWKKSSMLPAAILKASSAGTSSKSRSANGRRVRPVALDVRKVGGEHDVLDAHVVAQLDGHALDVLHAEEDVLPHVLAGPVLQRLEAEQPLRPVPVALVPVVGFLHPERHPARAGSRRRRSSDRAGDRRRPTWPAGPG